MQRLRALLREPLVHFLLIGAALFLAFGLTRQHSGSASGRIVVSGREVEQLSAQFARTWMRPPTDDEVQGLVREYVRDEVYYREALAMGLDRDDPIIRRRLRQKLEFILEDLTAEEPPGDATLEAYMQAHLERFQVQPRISFRQLYINPDRHPDPAAAARTMLARLDAGASPESLGDPTMLPYDFAEATTSDISRQFGEKFAGEVSALQPGGWVGPIYSGLGAHLVRVGERQEGRLPALEEVRDQVEREWLAQRRQELKDATYNRLLQNYQVVIEPVRTGEDKGAPPAQGTR
jgi:hypothetical protein